MLYRVWIIRLGLLLGMVLTLAVWGVSGAEGKLVVAWFTGGKLFSWQEGMDKPLEIASDSSRVFALAPGGEHIAFLQTHADLSQSVQVVGRDGSGQTELVSSSNFPSEEDNIPLIWQVEWLDTETVYFNTAHTNEAAFFITHDDLWSGNIQSGEVTQLLKAGEGGSLTFSADHTRMAVVSPGRYDGEQGLVRMMDVSGENAVNILAYDAVGTGSEYRYYPPVFWSADGQSVLVAIPDRDLIYDDAIAQTVLWRLGVDGTQTQIGSIQASFFGQPMWSVGQEQLAYLRREGESNQFDLMVAKSDGSEEQVYASGESGTLRLAKWLPGGTQFLFQQGQPGDYWIGEAGQEAQQVGSSIIQADFPDAETLVYFQTEGSQLELRYRREDADSSLITTLDDSDAWFDAVMTG